ncbi:hypothetical protein GVN21_16845 [Caulobacter sp. SLTY]|uniref:hypothetical protein n=1 Tax=Caulobacter sp. SLTY TaxID=2683262 RepID=UPI00141263BA|nr:hypothetical protein [Caulobacter sp. SLTY]NBB17036.1 hypothetical protein [Caulobacter sp. SLTY]
MTSPAVAEFPFYSANGSFLGYAGFAASLVITLFQTQEEGPEVPQDLTGRLFQQRILTEAGDTLLTIVGANRSGGQVAFTLTKADNEVILPPGGVVVARDLVHVVEELVLEGPVNILTAPFAIRRLRKGVGPTVLKAGTNEGLVLIKYAGAPPQSLLDELISAGLLESDATHSDMLALLYSEVDGALEDALAAIAARVGQAINTGGEIDTREDQALAAIAGREGQAINNGGAIDLREDQALAAIAAREGQAVNVGGAIDVREDAALLAIEGREVEALAAIAQEETNALNTVDAAAAGQAGAVEAIGDAKIAAIQALGPGIAYATINAGLAAVADTQTFAVLSSDGRSIDIFREETGKARYLGTSPFGDGVELAHARVASRSPLTARANLVAPLVEIMGIDAVFNGGRMLPSRTTAKPSRNLVSLQNFIRQSAVTPFYDGQWHRVVLPNSGVVVRYGTPANGVIGRNVVIAKSTAGAGNQTVRMGGDPGDLTDVALTEGAETIFDDTVTGTGARQFTLTAAAHPRDFLVRFPTVVEENEVPPDPLTGAPNTYAIMPAALSRAGQYTFSDGGVIGPVSRLPLTLTNGNKVWARGGYVVAIKLGNGAPGGDGNFGAMINSQQTYTPAGANVSYDTLAVGDDAGQLYITAPGSNGNSAKVPGIRGEGYYICAGLWSETYSESILEGVSLREGTGSGGTPPQLPYLTVFGGFTETRPPHADSRLGGLHLFDDTPTRDQLMHQAEVLRDAVRLQGGVFQELREMVFMVGDSNNVAFGATVTSIKVACESFARKPKYINFAQAGQGVGTFVTNLNSRFSNKTYQAALFEQIENAVAHGWRVYVIEQHGTNQTSTTTAALLNTNIWAPCRARGALVASATILSSAEVTHRTRINNEKVAAGPGGTGLFDVLIPIHLNAEIGVNGAYANPDALNPRFQGDGVHLLDAGQTVQAGLQAAGVAALRLLTPPTPTI